MSKDLNLSYFFGWNDKISWQQIEKWPNVCVHVCVQLQISSLKLKYLPNRCISLLKLKCLWTRFLWCRLEVDDMASLVSWELLIQSNFNPKLPVLQKFVITLINLSNDDHCIRPKLLLICSKPFKACSVQFRNQTIHCKRTFSNGLHLNPQSQAQPRPMMCLNPHLDLFSPPIAVITSSERLFKDRWYFWSEPPVIDEVVTWHCEQSDPF